MKKPPKLVRIDVGNEVPFVTMTQRCSENSNRLKKCVISINNLV